MGIGTGVLELGGWGFWVLIEGWGFWVLIEGVEWGGVRGKI